MGNDIRELIVEENGKDYLKTFVVKEKNSVLNAEPLFTHCELLLSKLVVAYNNKHKTRNTQIYQGYGADIQSLVNRFSGDYFSPSFLKSYEANPALLLMGNFFKEEVNDATAIGTTFHAVMEDYYNLPQDERTRSKLFDLLDKHIKEGQDREKLMQYVQGYYNIKDYLDPKKVLEDAKLDCVTEHRGREKLYVRSIDYTLPCAVSYVADRVDYRESGPVILDYKTGKPSPEWGTFEGYLGSMILYKWAMEQELNTDIERGFLIAPSAKKPYIEMDYSIDNQKKLAEIIDNFYTRFIADRKTRIYQYTDKGYFTSDDSKRFREVMNDNTLFNAIIPQKIYIGEHDDALLK